MPPSLKQRLTRNILNVPGWRTRRRIVVIESDDWGSIRIPSRQTYEAFVRKGYGVENSAYNRYDALESEDDLTQLFGVLRSVRDGQGKPAVLTANCIVANPDFERIKADNYQRYHYELVTDTFQSYPRHARGFELWQAGLREGLFRPQFHGREHLHVERWMKRLSAGDKQVRYCFDQRTTFSGNGADDYSFMEALDFDDLRELPELNRIVADGLAIFKQLFGYASASFIAPCYTWHRSMEAGLKAQGVDILQGNIIQLEPPLTEKGYRRRIHYMGEKNAHAQRYLIRNCIFEPTLNARLDSLAHCLKQIEIAFAWNKPAVISSHRLNYIGYLEEANRTRNLALLKELLTTVVQRWPNVEFMATDELGALMG